MADKTDLAREAEELRARLRRAGERLDHLEELDLAEKVKLNERSRAEAALAERKRLEEARRPKGPQGL